MDTEFQFCEMKWVLQVSGGEGHTVWIFLMPLTLYLKMVKVINYMYNLPQFKNEKYLEAKDKTCEIVWAKLFTYFNIKNIRIDIFFI